MVIAKIKEYKLGARGDRGAVISIPPIFLKDNNIIPGDVLEMHRGEVNGKDALVLFPKHLADKEQINSN